MQEYQSCKICSSHISIINKRYNLVQCNSCHFIFCNEIFSEKTLVKTYDDLYNNTSQYEKHQVEFVGLSQHKDIKLGWGKKEVLRYLLQQDVHEICEVGAGVGLVGNHLKSLNNIQYTGIEFDEKTAAKAQSLGLNVISGSFEKLSNFPAKFDAVIGFEVLEHLQDLKNFLELTHGCLKPGGFLGFSVPNYSKIKNYRLGTDKLYQDKPPIHLNFFSEENITLILQQAGFEIAVLKVKKLPYLNLKLKETYRLIYRALIGRFEGPTIVCVARKA
jgi:2-polyprenyl-3-methyl-5-hydroxy-6-metoxy-1,4-benzoquinol methylase